MEHPALSQSNGVKRLAFVAYNEQGSTIAMTQQAEEGWSVAQAVDSSHQVLGHIRPVWGPGGTLFWARRSETDSIEICRYDVPMELLTCQAIQTDAVWSMAAAGSHEVFVSVRQGMQWQSQLISW